MEELWENCSERCSRYADNCKEACEVAIRGIDSVLPTEVEQRMAALAAREQSVARWEEAVAGREAASSELGEALTKRSIANWKQAAALEERERRVQDRESSLAERGEALAKQTQEREAALEKRERSAAGWEESIEERERANVEMQEALMKRRGQLAAREWLGAWQQLRGFEARELLGDYQPMFQQEVSLPGGTRGYFNAARSPEGKAMIHFAPTSIRGSRCGWVRTEEGKSWYSCPDFCTTVKGRYGFFHRFSSASDPESVDPAIPPVRGRFRLDSLPPEVRAVHERLAGDVVHAMRGAAPTRSFM
eukprot:Hpha_TRINITY_DN7444_c0_g1::TRINITY_DN7444_c0_g1_i1::g.95967::m.95967